MAPGRVGSFLVLLSLGLFWGGCRPKAPPFTAVDESPELCRLLQIKAFPSHEICIEMNPKPVAQRAGILVRNTEALGESQYHHRLVTRTTVEVRPDEQLHLEDWGSFEVGGDSLVWVSIVRGDQKQFDRGHIVLYRYDPRAGSLKPFADRLECPANCSLQFLSFQSGGGKVTIHHDMRIDGQLLHDVYALGPQWSLVPLRIERSMSEAELTKGRVAPPSKDVCGRTKQVRKEIEKRLAFKDCKDIRPEDLATIELLDLRDRRIDRLEDGDFSGMPNLNRIDLSENPLSALSRSLFRGLFKLDSLNFQNCKLSGIPSRVFEDLISLKSLYLNWNQIEHLEPDSFAGLSSLTFLALNNNRIRSLPEGVFEPLKRLEHPYLNGNPLSRPKASPR